MCTCEVCQQANYTKVSFTAIPPMAWCGIDHPHCAHLWLQPSGITGYYAQCPGSTGPKPTEGDKR